MVDELIFVGQKEVQIEMNKSKHNHSNQHRKQYYPEQQLSIH